ncbi:AAA family ATPase [Candidatus Electronema sp. PJ]|uniref:AAA family ATPase n=1 Tax=Candidatus Electronema sp. PJ TaxID=3401572 RepID=UPI003AA7E6BF
MQYVKECLQLLYWIYFKPYTLKQHVQSICPEITDPYRDNFYRRSAAAKANPRLKRYDEQGWWLSALVPIVLVFLYVLLAEGVSRLVAGPDILYFGWWLSGLFLVGWLLGQIVVRAIRRKLEEKTAWILFIAALVLYVASAVLLKQLVADPFTKAALAVMGGVTAGIAGGIGGTMAVGVVGSVAVSVALGVVLGVALGIAASVAFGVVLGVALADAVGVAVFGITGGITGNVAFFILGILRVYCWLPEVLWMFPLRFWPGKATAKLPLMPTQLDQIIYFPLPFLPGLIAEAYQENQAAARQTIDYLITSTNQQKAAGKAVVAIAVEEFRRCKEAENIAAVREQLDWLPAKFASQQLQDCLDISQDVSAALEASSVFRQEQRLEQVCAKIIRLRTGLAAASARQATTFGGVLDHWLRLLESKRRTLRESAKRSEEIPQVYLAGPALDPNRAGNLFKGRRDLFLQIESLTLSAQRPTLALHGGRRTGKSSALNYLPKQMPSDILPLFVDCQGIAASSTLSGFAQLFAEQLIASARAVQQLDLPAPDKDNLSRDPFAALLGWLDAVEQAASSKTFLVCLDEFERLEELITTTGSRAPLNFLRHIIQHRNRWTLLLAGAHTPEELAPYWSDYLINTRTLRISFLDRDDALALIRSPVEEFPDIWPPAAAEAVWQLTQGQPYLTQLLCQEVVDHLNRKKAKAAQVSDVEEILPAAFEHGHYYFDEFWQALNKQQRSLLAAVAKAEPIPQELITAAPGLLRKEILMQENGGWVFCVPLLAQWLVAKLQAEEEEL